MELNCSSVTQARQAQENIVTTEQSCGSGPFSVLGASK